MTTILSVAQQKGGAGKTTLVIQLATSLRARGHRVGIVDIDPQASLAAWARIREHRREPAPELRFTMVAGWRLGVELERLGSDLDLVVIDTPPHAETEAKAAVRASNLVLVPVQPSSLDVWASTATVEVARRENRPVRLVINRVPPRGKAVEEALGAIRELGVRPLEARLGARLAFVQSVAQGLGVIESDPRSTAAEEVRALADEVATVLS